MPHLLDKNDTIDRISIMSSQIDTRVQTKILQTARQLVEDSAVSFTMDDLAAQTGLSRATIYRQMGGKKAILKRLAVEHGLDELNQPDIRSRILQAARTLFGQHGFVSPTMEQIAVEASVGVATIYRHFGDKPTLLKAFLQTYQPRFSIDQNESSGDFETDLLQMVQTMIQFILQNKDMVRLSFSNAREWQAQLAELRPFQERSLIRVANFLQNHIEAGNLCPIEPHQAATALLGMILSFCIIMPVYYQVPEPEPQETAVFITQLFLQGVQTPT